jgi:type III secretion system FlhB-like substrate exporter
MAKTKPKATDWKNRDIADWNATTFRSYLADAHEEALGVPYVANSIPVEAKNIKRLIEENGPMVVKRFIDLCLENYKPSSMYPSINFMFMYSYMRERQLPRAIVQVRNDETKDAQTETTESMDVDEALSWL